MQGKDVDEWQEIATELDQIQRGDDLTGLAMTWNKHLDTLGVEHDPPVVWFDSLSKMLEYVDIDSVVRFLQVCLGSLEETGATGHFLCRNTTVDPAAITTLRRVFSTVIRIEENGWTTID